MEEANMNSPVTHKRTGWAQLCMLLTANSISMIGNSLSAIAIPWFVFELTESAIATAGIVLAGQLPNLIVGILSGPFIDRLGPKRVSLFTDAVNFFAILLIPILFSLGALDMFLLAFLVFLSQVIDVPGYTARSVITSSLIDKHALPREKVNGLDSMMETGADFVGPILAGVLLTVLGAISVLVIDAFSFAISFVLIAFGIRLHRQKEERVVPISTVSIWKWMFQQKVIIRLAVYDLIISAVATSLLSLTLPLLAKTHYDQAIWLGIWLACFAAGTTLTTAAYTFLGHRISSLQLLRFTPVGQAVGLLIIAATLIFDGSGICISIGLFIFGLNLGVGSVVDATLLQKIVPEDKRGTVFAAFSSLRFSGVPIGLLVSGFILQQEAFSELFFLFAAVVAMTSLFWMQKSTIDV